MGNYATAGGSSRRLERLNRGSAPAAIFGPRGVVVMGGMPLLDASASVPFKYRAFLSYSHRDTSVAKRVHGWLEGFRVDKDLIGRETSTGPIPKQLRPIFRDRHDFDAGGTLAAQTVVALDNSAALILIASPAARRAIQ